MSRPRAIVAVLAGGEGSRLGGAKALVTLAGRPLIAYPLGAAREAGLEAIVVAKSSSRLPEALGARKLLEPEEPVHPLSGVVAALREGGAEAVLVLGCDMPFVPPALLAHMASLEGDVALDVDGRLQPLPSRIGVGGLASLERSLRAREPLGRAIAALDPQVLEGSSLASFGDPVRMCFSVNAHDDLAQAERWLAAEAG